VAQKLAIPSLTPARSIAHRLQYILKSQPHTRWKGDAGGSQVAGRGLHVAQPGTWQTPQAAPTGKLQK